MALGTEEHLDEIFRLLSEQHELLTRWPYSAEQITKDKELSARIRELIDRLCVSSPSTKVAS